MTNKNSYPTKPESDEPVLQRIELARGQTATLHEMPEEARNKVPILPIQARKLMGVVQAGHGRFAVFGESAHADNVENLLQATSANPMVHLRMRPDAAVYYIDPQAQRYISAGRMSETTDGRLTVGRATIASEAERQGLRVDTRMSREHFTLVQGEDGSLSIEDQSTNGTTILTGVEHVAEYDSHAGTSQDIGRTAIMPQIGQ